MVNIKRLMDADGTGEYFMILSITLLVKVIQIKEKKKWKIEKVL